MKSTLIAALFAAGALAVPHQINKRATFTEEITTTQWTTTTVFVDATGAAGAFAEHKSRTRSSNSSSIATSTASSSVVSSSSSSLSVALPTTTLLPTTTALPTTLLTTQAPKIPTTTEISIPQTTAAVAAAAAAVGGSGYTGSGDATYYNVAMGTTSCGGTHSGSEFVVAISALVMNTVDNSNPNKNVLCGKSITISYKGKSQTATVVDTCPGGECTYGSLDLSQSLFEALVGPISIGRVSGITWSM